MIAADLEGRAGTAPRRITAAARRWWVRVLLARPRRTVGVLVVAAVLAGAAVGWLAWERSARLAVDHVRAAASSAAVVATARVLSYDHHSMDADIAAAREQLTGGFLEDYTVLMAQSVAPAAVRNQTVTTAEVEASSVVSAGPDQVELLLFVNQTTTGVELAGPKLDSSRVMVTMDEVDGRWLISTLRPV